jgi:nucleotidyltransferase/DNA polymerase involved in DNA repair
MSRRATRPAALSAETAALKELQTIPGVGPSIARDLYDIGIRRVADLHGADPKALYDRSNAHVGAVQDRCLLYTFRCAVYYATQTRHQPDKLLWWNWKDTPARGAHGNR